MGFFFFFFFKLGAGYVATQKANDVTVARVVQCHVPVTEQTNRTNPHKLVVLLLECIDRLLIGLLFFFFSNPVFSHPIVSMYLTLGIQIYYKGVRQLIIFVVLLFASWSKCEKPRR